MAKVKLLTDGGYKGLEAAVGKTFEATKVLGHWNVSGDDLTEAGCTTCMVEYAFLQREVEVVRCRTQGL